MLLKSDVSGLVFELSPPRSKKWSRSSMVVSLFTASSGSAEAPVPKVSISIMGISKFVSPPPVCIIASLFVGSNVKVALVNGFCGTGGTLHTDGGGVWVAVAEAIGAAGATAIGAVGTGIGAVGAVGAVGTGVGAGAIAATEGGAVAEVLGACFCAVTNGFALLAIRPDGGFDLGAGLWACFGVGCFVCFGDGRFCSTGGLVRVKGTAAATGLGGGMPGAPMSGKGATGLPSALGMPRFATKGEPPAAVIGATGTVEPVGLRPSRSMTMCAGGAT